KEGARPRRVHGGAAVLSRLCPGVARQADRRVDAPARSLEYAQPEHVPRERRRSERRWMVRGVPGRETGGSALPGAREACPDVGGTLVAARREAVSPGPVPRPR